MADDFLKNTIDQVADIIDDAVSSNDYSDLSRKIGSLMRDVVDTAGTAVKYAASSGDAYRSRGQAAAKEAADRKAREREELRKAAREREAKAREEEKYFARAEEPVGSKIMGVIGGAGTVLFGLLTMLFSMFSVLQVDYFSNFTGFLAVILGLLTACSIAMLVSGRKAARKAVRFKSYRKLIMPKLYADISDLSREMQLPPDTVVKDLEDFTKNGKIKQGHFDDTNTCFIASDELYAQYRGTVERAERKRQEDEAEAARNAAVSPEIREILSKGEEYITMIHRANDAIPDEQITEKLNRMEMIVRRIFEEVREKPSLAGSLNMFMNYYLPTTTKLVAAYEEMDSQPMQGENIRKAKKEIADSLDTINTAFETLLDSFFRDQAMDVSSDISVMKMMMKQDGLTADDLSKVKKKTEAKAAAKAPAGAAAETPQSAAAVFEQQVSRAGAAAAGSARAAVMEEKKS